MPISCPFIPRLLQPPFAKEQGDFSTLGGKPHFPEPDPDSLRLGGQDQGQGPQGGGGSHLPFLAGRLLSYAYRAGIKPEEKIFPVSSPRVWQIVDRAFDAAGICKTEHVGTVRVLRRSGAVARLAATGNPKAVQDQLQHKEAKMAPAASRPSVPRSPSKSSKE
jgi:hypothetical protein